MGWLTRCWNGEEEIWKLVWIYGVFLVFLSQVAVVALRLLSSVALDNPAAYEGKIFIWLEVFYCLWMLVSLWRCAFNADWNLWGYCVRTIVILYVLLYCLLSFNAGGALEPKEIITKSGVMLQKQAIQWMKKNGMDSRVKAVVG